MKSQDTKILLSLIDNSDGSTAYTISKNTGISNPQVIYRLEKLIKSKVVISQVRDDKIYYYAHPALVSEGVMKKITTLIKEVADEIDRAGYTEPAGMKFIIELIISRLDISEPELESDLEVKDKDHLIDEFRKKLELYAKEKNIKITNIKGWTVHKIKWMALNEEKCCCAPDKRKCPCEEGLDEVMSKGKCLCSVFEYKGEL